MESTLHRYSLLIREYHLDTFGHVNNATYLQIFEEARWEAITSRGFGLKHIQTSGRGPVILELNLRFLKELRLRQQIEICTQVEKIEGKVSHLKQWIVNPAGETATEARFLVGLFDLNQRKLIEPDEQWLRALGIES